MRWFIVLMVLSLVLVACSTTTATPVVEVADPAPTEPKATQEQNAPSATEVQETESVEVESGKEAPKIEVRDELQATDPTTVALGNGSPTLVEFFAFW
jgi:hypothetical protein